METYCVKFHYVEGIALTDIKRMSAYAERIYRKAITNFTASP